MNKIIFLDIDGVLNGCNLRVYIMLKLMKRFRFLKKYFDIFNVQILKVFILFIIIRLTKAEIVLTSSWRYGYYKVPYKSMNSQCKRLYILFKFFRIHVCDVTTRNYSERGKQISEYLKTHKSIDKYLIIDDEMFDISDHFYKKNLLSTKADENRLIKFNCCGCYDGAGLKFKHISEAVRKLK